MTKTTFKMTGFKELEKALAEELPKTTARAVLRRAGVEALKPLQAKAKQNAPVDSGALRDSIIIKPGWDPDFNAAASASFKEKGTARGVKRQRGRMSFGLGVQARFERHKKSGKPTGLHAYSQYQEYGTESMPAQPYMRPAVDSEGEATLGRVRDALEEEIKKAAARIAKRAARKRT